MTTMMIMMMTTVMVDKATRHQIHVTANHALRQQQPATRSVQAGFAN